MSKIEFPIVEIENNKFQVIVDLNLYSKDTIISAIYKFSDVFFVHQQSDSNNPTKVVVIFETKNGNVVQSEVPKQFCNELIDQQIRHNVNEQFGHIRDMIVEEAFKPVSK